MDFTVVIKKEGKLYSALAPELDIASQGKSIEEAKKNIKEAIELYFEDEDAKVKHKSVHVCHVNVKRNAKTSSSVC